MSEQSIYALADDADVKVRFFERPRWHCTTHGDHENVMHLYTSQPTTVRTICMYCVVERLDAAGIVHLERVQ